VRKKGFLLFEVMMSIVIITTGILFIMRSYSSSKMSIERSTEIFRTSLLLESQMWEYEEEGKIREERDRGDFEEPEGYSWEIEAEPLEEEEGEGFSITFKPKLNVVRLSVFEEKDRKNTEYYVWTYLKNKF
jgi:hypothetical protein